MTTFRFTSLRGTARRSIPNTRTTSSLSSPPSTVVSSLNSAPSYPVIPSKPSLPPPPSFVGSSRTQPRRSTGQ